VGRINNVCAPCIRTRTPSASVGGLYQIRDGEVSDDVVAPLTCSCAAVAWRCAAQYIRQHIDRLIREALIKIE
jgi:hypothetical protein